MQMYVHVCLTRKCIINLAKSHLSTYSLIGLKTYTKRSELAASTLTAKHPRLLESFLDPKRNTSKSLKHLLDASVDANRVDYEHSAGPYLSGLESLNEVMDQRLEELRKGLQNETGEVSLFLSMYDDVFIFRLRCSPRNAYNMSECRKERKEDEFGRALLVNEIKTLRYVNVNFAY
jgi:hypothetical protein